MLPVLNVLGYNVFNGKIQEIDLENKTLINTFSPNSYGVAQGDPDFEKALKGTDVLVLDGIGIALGSILLHGKNIKKIAGQDCFDYLMEVSDKNNWKVFLLGSSQSTLNKMFIRASKEYPGISLSYYSPPYKSVFDEHDNNMMVEAINNFKPDVLFVAMTAPKQEKWAFQHKNQVNARIISTVGNVFDWYAGISKRPGKFWIKLRLEWLVRIFLRPEIFRRNTKNQLVFLKDLLLYILRIKRIK